MRRLLKMFGADKRGVALVETAIALPFLTVIFIGVIALGDAYARMQLLESAASDAARYLARTTDPATSLGLARNVARCGQTTCAAGTERACYITAESTTITVRTVANSGLYRGPDPISIVQARVTPAFSSTCAAPFFGFDANSVFGFIGVHEERVIGQ